MICLRTDWEGDLVDSCAAIPQTGRRNLEGFGQLVHWVRDEGFNLTYGDAGIIEDNRAGGTAYTLGANCLKQR